MTRCSRLARLAGQDQAALVKLAKLADVRLDVLVVEQPALKLALLQEARRLVEQVRQQQRLTPRDVLVD